ncbi:MAG: putative transcriptional regulator, Nlp [Polaromonas sp.]|nr:putative transcriptional regulator, Nlp [Polaromonas sp.]
MDTQKCKAHHDWHPADVKAALEKKGLSLARLAKANGYSHFQRVLTTHWWAAEQIVAKALGTPADKIWPSRYAETRERAQRMTRNISVDRKGRIHVEGRP